MKKLALLLALLLVGVAAAAPSVVSTTQTSATVEGLDCGTKYRFEIRKYTPSGELSATADSVDAQTKSCPDTQPPSAPAGLAATGATQTAISVSWNASTDNLAVAGYDVYRDGTKIDSTTATSFTFGGLSCGTSHTLAVEAHDAAGNRSPRSAITASTSACPPPSCPTGQYSAQYHGNMTLSGTPALQRCEAAVNHGWASGSPAPVVPVDGFSTRWTGTFLFTAATYEFTATADDGIRVWVDGALVIDAWKDQAATTYRATRTLTAGDHAVKVEYYENGGAAAARVSWQATQQPVPPPSSSCPTGEYSGQYYGNMTLSATPVLQRCERTVNYEWGSGSPTPAVPVDGFSGRWTGTFSFAAGSYEFTATADDGIRVWVDGAVVIDAWKDQPATTYTATKTLTAGGHVVKVEYYENGGAAEASVLWAPAPAPAPPPPPPGTVTLQPVDGGTNYYARFANALPADKFPIGAWAVCVNSQSDVDQDRAAGINIYVNFCRSGPWVAEIMRANGALAFLQHEDWLQDAPAINDFLAGWSIHDEIDMQQGPAGCAKQEEIKATFPNDGRLRYNNFGKGVIFWQTDAQAACFVNGVDLPSSDVYWFADAGVCSAGEGGGKAGVVKENSCHVAANYGWQVQRMRNLVNPRGSKPVWSFVELGHVFPDSSWPSITVPQLRAAVWHSLIAGARGITYFNHSFGGPNVTHNILRDSRYAAVRTAVVELNSRIQSLKAALDSPSLASGFQANANVRAMAKWDGANFYVFAGTAGHFGPATGSFAIPCVGNATATVLGESRSIPVSGGSFSDTFADPNAVHIYRIDGGSSCGLS
jgi:chitodextrinase